MLLRATLCALILIMQPLAAWSGVMPMPAAVEAAEAALASDHCDDMAAHHQSGSSDVAPDETECDIGCDDCTFSAGIAARIPQPAAGFVPAAPAPYVVRALPPGRTDSPYRPPAFA